MHVDHVLLFAPNIQLSGKVTGTFEKPIPEEYLSEGLFAIASNVHERVMQPFPETEDINCESFFFGPKKTLEVVVYRDTFPKQTKSPISVDAPMEYITSGTLTIEGRIYIDSNGLNCEGEIPNEKAFFFTPSGHMSKKVVDTYVKSVEECHSKISRFAKTFKGISKLDETKC